jgi:hypothetical protein
MKFYLAVTKSKNPKVIIAEVSYHDCMELGKFYSRGRNFEVVERYLILDNEKIIFDLMEGCSLEHIDFIINESTAHLPDGSKFDQVKPPMKVYLPDEFIEHMSTVTKDTKQ